MSVNAVSDDPRYAFMFTMAVILRYLFRLQLDGKPVAAVQLAGIPSEVVDVVVSVLCRTAFDFGLWSDGAIELLLVCEEAHRYVAADRSKGFQPIRTVPGSQRKAAGTAFLSVSSRSVLLRSMRPLFRSVTRYASQQLVRAAASVAVENPLRFLPSLAMREVLAFGAGMVLPTNVLPTARPPYPAQQRRQWSARESGLDDRLISWWSEMARSDDQARLGAKLSGGFT